jgi:gas vesicle structural protein
VTVARSAGGDAAGPSSSSLADVIDTILDKGLVIDAYVRVSLVGIELLTIDARIVVASVDTYLRFAEAVGRMNIADDKQTLPGLVGQMQEGGASAKTKGVIRGALDAAGERPSPPDEGDRGARPQRRRRHDSG